MPVTDDGVWVPDLNPRQFDVFNCNSRYLLTSGCRLSGKTHACLHKIVRHMWELNGARVGMFARTTKSATEGGSYKILLDTVVPEWLNANLVSPQSHLDYTMQPKCDNATRTHKFALRNYWGTSSEFYLFSLDHDDDVEEKVKNLAFSMFYFIELSNFNSRRVFDITKLQLRLTPRIPFSQHQWIGDTNPADDGEDSWIHQLFYQKDAGKVMAKDEHGNVIEDRRAFTDQIKVIEFTLLDNPKLDPDQVIEVKQSYAHDPDLYDRYILGKWKKALGGGVFGDVFLDETHIHGDASSPHRADWQIIIPTEFTFELLTGWDMGDVNHAGHMAQKRLIAGSSVFDIIDELVCIKERISIVDFTAAMVEKMDEWEKLLKDMYGRASVLWRHWSDSSALEYKSAADANEHRIVYAASDGRINLQSIAKPRGSVKKRVDLVRRLLFEQRLFFSAQLHDTIAMMKSLKRAKSSVAFLKADDPLKHPFDSMSYILAGEEPMDIESRMPGVSTPTRRVVAVRA